MKIAVAGKGGVGKTAVAAGLAREAARRGHLVLAIDADPDQNLGAALGIAAAAGLQPISEMRELIEQRVGEPESGIFRLNPEVADLPERCWLEHEGVRLMVMGTVAHGGSGCMCRPNSLLRSLVQHILLDRNELVVLDMVAGIEHLGRGTASAVDAFLLVVEPQPRALETARRIRDLALDLGIREVLTLANKIRDASDLAFVQDRLDGAPLLGTLHFSNGFLARVPPTENDEFMADIATLADGLLARASPP